MDILHRPMRLRKTEQIRKLVRDVNLNMDSFILPIFIKDGKNIKNAISSMPNFYQYSIDRLDEELVEITKLGIKNVILFGIPSSKDLDGLCSISADGVIQRAIRHIKSQAPELLVIADVCLCEYTSHGHCGILNNDAIDNDKTLLVLAKQSVSYAEAGADIIAPSAMMDGMVREIRSSLDNHGYANIPIMSYSAKYASAMYGPFRIAAEGAPQFGDRKSYQMDFSRADEALHEVALDIEEGADIVMIKPAHTYLDIIYKVKQKFPYIPIAAYHTSGEYVTLKAAAAHGWIDEKNAIFEVITAIKRAGANLVITYCAKDLIKNYFPYN